MKVEETQLIIDNKKVSLKITSTVTGNSNATSFLPEPGAKPASWNELLDA